MRGTLIVTAVGVLLLYKREDLWYKKIDTGIVVVPVCVLSETGVLFFSPAGALVFMAGAFIFRLWCGCRAPGRRVDYRLSPTGRRRGVGYYFHFDCKNFSSSYTFSASTGENNANYYTLADIKQWWNIGYIPYRV